MAYTAGSPLDPAVPAPLPDPNALLPATDLDALLAGTTVAVAFFPNAPEIGTIPHGFPTPVLPSLHLDVIASTISAARSESEPIPYARVNHE